jgi:hypothetical protein
MKSLALLVVLALLLGSGALALADTTTAPSAVAKHPKISEVHSRLKDQMKRIRIGVKNGKLTQDQANALIASLKAVRAQMQADFTTNGKKELTDDQLAQLNQMLDANSKTIYGEKHDISSTNNTSSANNTNPAPVPTN